jgi:uroporphyrinogen decarboxylase
MLDACRSPELVTEITLQPVRRYGVDAAILFSDIVVPIAAIGFGVDVAPGTGPVTEQPFRSRTDLDRIRPLEAELDIPYVLETVKILSGELDVPLIGFAGAPFTVASYLIESPLAHVCARSHEYSQPVWHRLPTVSRRHRESRRCAQVRRAPCSCSTAAGDQRLTTPLVWPAS